MLPSEIKLIFGSWKWCIERACRPWAGARCDGKQTSWDSSCCSLGAQQIINLSTQKLGGNVPCSGSELFLSCRKQGKGMQASPGLWLSHFCTEFLDGKNFIEGLCSYVKFSPMWGVTLTVNWGSCGKQPAAAFFIARRDAAAGFWELAALRVTGEPCQQTAQLSLLPLSSSGLYPTCHRAGYDHNHRQSPCLLTCFLGF